MMAVGFFSQCPHPANLVFRSWKFSNTYAIVFFFLQTFQRKFQNCSYDFYQVLHSLSTPKGAPACAMASKLCEWDVKNMAKISPKMTKKLPFLDFSFRFSQKLSIMTVDSIIICFSMFQSAADSFTTHAALVRFVPA